MQKALPAEEVGRPRACSGGFRILKIKGEQFCSSDSQRCSNFAHILKKLSTVYVKGPGLHCWFEQVSGHSGGSTRVHRAWMNPVAPNAVV